MILIMYQLPQIQNVRPNDDKMRMLFKKYSELIRFPKQEGTKTTTHIVTFAGFVLRPSYLAKDIFEYVLYGLQH